MSAIWQGVLDVLKIVVVPLVLLAAGFVFDDALARQDLDVKYVEIAVSILAEKPSGGDEPLRQWAVDVWKKHSPVPVPEGEALEAKLRSSQLRFPPLARDWRTAPPAPEVD